MCFELGLKFPKENDLFFYVFKHYDSIKGNVDLDLELEA